MPLNLNQIPYIPKQIYTCKLHDFTVLYNPYSYRGILIINAKAKKIFHSINGKNNLKKIINTNKNILTETVIMSLFKQLINYHIVSFSQSQNTKLRISYRSFSAIKSLSLWIHLTNQCNFRCTYCFVDKNNITFTKKKIDKLLTMLIPLQKKYHYKSIRFLLAGGEPLSRFSLVRHIVKKAAFYKKTYQIPINLSIITNGSLITEEYARFFKQHRIKIGVSLDGIGESNDQTRKFPDGKGTFKYTERGLQILQQLGVLFNVSATITMNNVYNLHTLVMYCLKQKIPISLEFFAKLNDLCKEEVITEERQFIEQYKKILTTIYKYYFDHNLLYSPLKHNNLLHPLRILHHSYYESCLGGLNYFSIFPNGTVRFCAASDMAIASLDSKDFVKEAKKNYLMLFKNAMPDDIKECQQCLWRYNCAGGCKLERLIIDKKAPSVKCGIYKELIPFIIKLEAQRIINLNMFLISKRNIDN